MHPLKAQGGQLLPGKPAVLRRRRAQRTGRQPAGEEEKKGRKAREKGRMRGTERKGAFGTAARRGGRQRCLRVLLMGNRQRRNWARQRLWPWRWLRQRQQWLRAPLLRDRQRWSRARRRWLRIPLLCDNQRWNRARRWPQRSVGREHSGNDGGGDSHDGLAWLLGGLQTETFTVLLQLSSSVFVCSRQVTTQCWTLVHYRIL